MLQQLRSQTVVVSVLLNSIRFERFFNPANLDEEAEVVLDAILVPIFHLDFSDVPLSPLTEPSSDFVNTFTFGDQSIFPLADFVGTKQRPGIGVWVCR